ncbi:MAG: T9SS type A sorting domain-containing protein [Bacteroidetes bacterium]|nr:T9SS type A sorting domain-containing protein [Bacteroidota bacterium]
MKSSGRIRISRRQRQRISYKQLFIATSSIAGAAITGLLIYFQFGQSEQAMAAFQNDYRTVSSGSWQTAHIWEKYDGSQWGPTNTPPNATSNSIEIRSGHTVVISTKVEADQIIVDEGAKLEVLNGTLNVQNGNGTDLRVNGELEVSGNLNTAENSQSEISKSLILKESGEIDLKGQIEITGTFVNEGGQFPIDAKQLTIGATGTYVHHFDGGSLPVANWEPKSTCEISGVTTTLPDHINQNFGSVKWNCQSQAKPIDLNGQITSIQNSFILESTGSQSICFNRLSSSTTTTLGEDLIVKGGILTTNPISSHIVIVNGSFSMYSGTFNFNSSTSKSNTVMSIKNDMTITGGSLNLNESKTESVTKGIVNVGGNFSVTGTGLITEHSLVAGAEVNFNGKQRIQFAVTNENTKNKIDFNVCQGATLRLDNYTLSGTGSFRLNDGAAILAGSPDGISQSEMKGNIQVQGARYFSPEADYTFNSNTPQITGSGLPTKVHNLTLNNEKNCTLSNSVSVSGTLNLLSGNWITNNNSITLGTGERNTGSIRQVEGHVIGQLNRWVNPAFKGEIGFPVGSDKFDNTASINFTKAPTHAGIISCSFSIGNVNTLGMPMSDSKDVLQNVGYAYWSFLSSQSYEGGEFDLKLQSNGFPGIQDFSKLHVVNRPSSYSAWTASGKHAPATGSNESAQVIRTGLTGFGMFGIASDNSNSLPAELIYFQTMVKNKQVVLTWAMATEHNNDYFTIERSENGTEFKSIGTVKGAGTSIEMQKYTFEDRQPSQGVSFYRLRQTTFDGKSIVSTSEKVHVQSENTTLTSVNIQRLGPNPFHSLFTAEYYSDKNGDVAVELIDSNGKAVFKKYQYAVQGHNTFTFDEGSNLSAGEYMVRISNTKGVSKMKIVKKD